MRAGSSRRKVFQEFNVRLPSVTACKLPLRSPGTTVATQNFPEHLLHHGSCGKADYHHGFEHNIITDSSTASDANAPPWSLYDSDTQDKTL